jgi:REP element-mobilizing transposase RayT
MGRAARIEVPGGTYHVGARGNRGCRIYADDHERQTFLSMFGDLATRHGWTLGTYCLMSNHYHLLMEIEEGLSDGMRELNGGFSSYTNARNGLEGHLFRNRFWCELVKDEAHYLQTARYIVLNPIRAGLCASPEDWQWSSYRACVGLDFAPPFLAADELLRCFGDSPATARNVFRRFVSDELDAARAQTRLGVRHRHGSETR